MEFDVSDDFDKNLAKYFYLLNFRVLDPIFYFISTNLKPRGQCQSTLTLGTHLLTNDLYACFTLHQSVCAVVH